MILESIKNIYKALVIRVKKKKVLIDARLKCLYYVPINDFAVEDLENLVGKEIDVYIRHIDPIINKNKIASHRRAKQEIIWNEIIRLFNNKELVEGKFVNATKGGYSIYLNIGFYAFLPLSQICEDETEKYKPEHEESFTFQIIGINRLHFNIVVSRKEVVMKDIAKLNEESMDTINLGASLFGVVKGINSNGLFIYINEEYTGFIPTEEAGHGNNIDLYKNFHIGQRIEAIIIELHEDKIILSIRKHLSNPMLEFTRGQKIDVIINKCVSEHESEVMLLGYLANNSNIFCRIIKEDRIITQENINSMIEKKEELTVTIKSINEDAYSLICTTKKSQREIWNNFMLDVQNNNYIVNATVTNKSKYMLFLSYLEKEIYVPITQVSFNDSYTKFENIQPGDIIKVFIIYLDKKHHEALGSIRRIEITNSTVLRTQVDDLIKKGVVDASLEYMIDNNYAIFKLQDTIEQSVACNKIGNLMHNLKNNPHVPIKLQIYNHDEYGNLEIGPVNEISVKSNVKTKKFNITDVISQFKSGN